MRSAAETAEAAGLESPDLAVQWMLDCAHYLGGAFDPAAQLVTSSSRLSACRTSRQRGSPEPGLLGSGKLPSGFCNDWITAAHYPCYRRRAGGEHEGTVGFASLNSILALTRHNSDRLKGAVDAAWQAFADAQVSGRKPQLGPTAGAAAHLCLWFDRRIRGLGGGYGSVLRIAEATASPPPWSWRVTCTAGRRCFGLAGRFDEALERIAAATAATRETRCCSGALPCRPCADAPSMPAASILCWKPASRRCSRSRRGSHPGSRPSSARLALRQRFASGSVSAGL